MAHGLVSPNSYRRWHIAAVALRAGQTSRLLIASSREYIADAEAVQLTKNPGAMASALVAPLATPAPKARVGATGALDTVTLALIAGGVIVTDWYVNPQSPGERVKLTISILDQDLRADALRVAGSREVSQNGQWVAAPLRAATVQKLEAVILTKARDLRRSSITG